MTLRLLIPAFALLLAGCDIPGMGPDPKIAQREAEAKAIGGACRHGLRSIEDCYTLNEGASKADMFIGWKEMDQYMRENKIEGVRATVAPVEEIIEDKKSKASAKDKASTESKEKSSEAETEPDSKLKPKSKGTEKPAAKSAEKPAEKAATR